MHVARHLDDIDVDIGIQQLHRLEVDAVDGVHLAGHQRVHAGRGVTDIDLLHFGEVAAVVGIPVVVELGDHGAHARLESDNLVRAGSDAVGDCLGDLACREDTDVVVGDEIGEVGTAALQVELYLVVGQLLHLLDRGHNRLGSRLRAFLDMHVHRRDDVIGAERLAVVELHALAQVEGPDFGVGRCFPALREFADQFAGRGYLGQGLEHATCAHVDHEAVGMGTAVPGVGRVAARHADGVGATMFRRRHGRHAGDRKGTSRSSRFQRGPPRDIHCHCSLLLARFYWIVQAGIFVVPTSKS